MYNTNMCVSVYLFCQIEQSNITNELLEEEAALTALNHIRNIKVYWRKMKTYRFPLRMV